MNISSSMLLMCLAAFTIVGCNGVVNSDLFGNSIVWRDTTYAISNFGPKNIEEAMSICKVSGGYLVEIDDSSELTYVRHLVIISHVPDEVYIAGSDAHNEGTWIFQRTGKPVKKFDWGQGQPDKWPGEADCLTFTKSPLDPKMNDHPCDNGGPETRFICEIPNV